VGSANLSLRHKMALLDHVYKSTYMHKTSDPESQAPASVYPCNMRAGKQPLAPANTPAHRRKRSPTITNQSTTPELL
jgi:hypothetical protein